MAGAVEKAYKQVRQQLLEGRLRPGEPLREEALACAVGVSRTPIREALRRLEQEGLIEYISNQGFVATIWEFDELKHLLEIRAHIEGYLSRITAERISSEQIDRLRALAESMIYEANKEDPDLALIADQNAQFHSLVLAAASCPRISSIASSVRDLSFVHRPNIKRNIIELRRSLSQHIDLVTAFEARDGDLVEAIMKAHILGSWRAVKLAYTSISETEVLESQ
jgi:DNA-binding GntR family transcriptional regulator